MTETKMFVIFDHANVNEQGEASEGEASVRIVRYDALSCIESLWNELDDAKRDGRKIAVFKLGKCILNWS